MPLKKYNKRNSNGRNIIETVSNQTLNPHNAPAGQTVYQNWQTVCKPTIQERWTCSSCSWRHRRGVREFKRIRGRMSPATIRATALCGSLIRLLRDKKATDKTTMRHTGLRMLLQSRPAKQLNTHVQSWQAHTLAQWNTPQHQTLQCYSTQL